MTAPKTTPSSATPYHLGDLDVGAHGGSLELDMPPANGNGASAFAGHGSITDDTRAPASSLRSPMPAPAHLSDHDEDSLDVWAELPALELAHDPQQAAAATPRRTNSAQPRATPDPAARPADIARQDARPLPPGTLIPALQAQLAELPETPWAYPGYALHALQALAQLLGEKRTLRRELKEREAALDEALLTLGRALTSHAADPRMGSLKTRFSAVGESELRRGSVESAVQSVREGQAQALEAIATEAQTLAAELIPCVAAEATRKAQRDAADAALLRATALQKRAEIELRAANQAATPRPEGQLLALTQALAERTRSADEGRAALVQADEHLGAARRELALKRGAQALLDQRRAAITEEAAQRQRSLEKRSQLLLGSEKDALRRLAVAAREGKLDGVAKAAAEEADKRTRELTLVQDDLAAVAAAFHACDRRMLAKGLGMGVLGLVLFWVALIR